MSKDNETESTPQSKESNQENKTISEEKIERNDSEKRMALKDSFLLYFAVILGAIGAIWINYYFVHPDFWFGVVMIVYLLFASFIGGYLTYCLVYVIPKYTKKLRK
jgi:uncharacterized membrane protein YoaK (UPF0700 family)